MIVLSKVATVEIAEIAEIVCCYNVAKSLTADVRWMIVCTRCVSLTQETAVCIAPLPTLNTIVPLKMKQTFPCLKQALH